MKPAHLDQRGDLGLRLPDAPRWPGARPATVSAGRSLPAELTREGRVLLGKIEADVRDAERKVLAPLDESDQQQPRRLLADLG